MARERVIIGEAVEVELPIARLATRTIALLIDVVAIQIPLVIAIFLVALPFVIGQFSPEDALIAAMTILGLVFIFLIVPVTVETLSRGRSLGKLAMGLRVVRDDGGPIRFRHALVRGLVGLVIEWPGLLLPVVTWAFGGTAMLFNSKAKRIGDLAAGTMVLQERLPDRGRYVAAMPPPLAAWASTLDLTGVDDDLAMTVRQFLSRAHELREGPRAALGQRLVNEVLAVTTPPPPAGTSGWWYLAAVVAERRRREELRLAGQRPIVALGAPSPAVPHDSRVIPHDSGVIPHDSGVIGPHAGVSSPATPESPERQPAATTGYLPPG